MTALQEASAYPTTNVDAAVLDLALKNYHHVYKIQLQKLLSVLEVEEVMLDEESDLVLTDPP